MGLFVANVNLIKLGKQKLMYKQINIYIIF